MKRLLLSTLFIMLSIGMSHAQAEVGGVLPVFASKVIQSSEFKAMQSQDEDEYDVRQIKVFPNPTTNYIQLSSVKGITQIEIFSLIGKRVRMFEVSDKDEKHDVTDLPNGMYLVRLLDEEGDTLATKRISKR